MISMHATLTIGQIIKNAGCARHGYSVDVCRIHNSYWPYDETTCNSVLRILGLVPRRVLGDGRASGSPVIPR